MRQDFRQYEFKLFIYDSFNYFAEFIDDWSLWVITFPQLVGEGLVGKGSEIEYSDKALHRLFTMLLEHSAQNELKREALHNRRLFLHLLFKKAEKTLFYVLLFVGFRVWKQQFVVDLFWLLMLFL